MEEGDGRKQSKAQKLATEAIDFAELGLSREEYDKFKVQAMRLWKKNDSDDLRTLDKVRIKLLNLGKVVFKKEHQVEGFASMINEKHREIAYE